MPDMSATIAPKSDQMNADDLLAGPRTFTITRVDVREGGEQPVKIWLAEFPEARPYKPSKSMRRVLVVGWGKDSDVYVGRRFTLYRNPTVKYAGQEVGGIQISHMSHLRAPLSFALTTAQTKRDQYAVQPLTDEPTPPKPLNTNSALAREMYAAMEQAQVSKEGAGAWLSEAIGRPVGSSKELTEDEARTVLSRVKEASNG